MRSRRCRRQAGASGRPARVERSFAMRSSLFRTLVRVVVLGAAVAGPAHAQVKALRFGAVVDVPGHVIRDAVILVDGDKISRIVDRDYRLPDGAQVIDLTRFTAIPGMIDVHTHMTYYWDSTSGTDPWRQPQRTPAQTVEFARANAL